MGGRLSADARRPRLGPGVLWVSASAVVLFSAAISQSHPGATSWGASTWSELLGAAAGLGLVAAGAWLCWRRLGLGGVLLAAAGVGWCLGEWNNPGVGSSALFTIGIATSALSPALIAHATLAYPSGRVAATRERVAVLLAYGDALIAGLAVVMFFDPRTQGCALCPSNLLLVHGSAPAVTDMQRAGLWLGALWPVWFTVVAVWSLARSSAPLRRLRWIVTAGGVAYALLGWFATLRDGRAGELGLNVGDHRIWLLQAATILVVTVGAFMSSVIRRRTRSAIARVVLDLGALPPPGGLRDALARWLEDPDLQIVFRVHGSDRWADREGILVDLPRTGRSVTPIERRGAVVGMLVHGPGVPEDPRLLDGFSAASFLAFENERLRAELLAQLRDLRASLARIVSRSDEERRRIERDLHDGAQQRLVGLSMTIGMARARLKEEDLSAASLLVEAGRHASVAVESLREVAHGIYPPILADEGLGAAAHVLAERASVPLQILEVPDRRCPPDVESAGYAVIRRAVEAFAGATADPDFSVAIHHEDGRLVIRLIDRQGSHDRPRALDLTEIEDRVGALDGTIRLERSKDGSMTIEAEIPCES